MLRRKPKNHTVVDMYKTWCSLMLKENSNYFDEYDKQVRWKDIRIIYERTKIATLIPKEIPTGLVNGKNRVYLTNHTAAGDIKVYKNGTLLTTAYKADRDYYVIANHTIMLEIPPKPGDIIHISYEFLDHKMIMSYTMFRLIIEMYNKYASDAIIHGHRFDLGSRLGYLFPARIERSFLNPKVDVVATMQMRKKIPDHPAIFFTSFDYCMVKWQKLHKIRNESVYTFVTAKNTMRRDFCNANKSNPVLKTQYRFYPFQRQQSA